ncbi:tellurite resistance TerB family protein [Frigidibacter sp. MR17.24]|uniref:tellurite resistance TerB family protein n=1 Tax=Frigidibacter sp. MR17.24 TaxID=3127345 RepID=UPI003012F0C6
MSLLKTLAKVAIGVAAAKGVKTMMDQRRQPYDQSRGRIQSRQTGLGGLLDRVGQRGGGLDQLIAKAGGAGGLGGILAGAGLGGLLGGGGQARAGGFAAKLDQAQRHGGEPEHAPTPEEEAVAALLLRAMIQAAKSDGRIDGEERARILSELDDASREEMDFLMREMEAPIDVEGLVAATPAGLEPEVYAAALMAIDVDHPAEISYLRALARGLQLREAEVSEIHREAGLPPLATA